MKEVKVNGTTYGLALGPAVLSRLQGMGQGLIPVAMVNEIEKARKEGAFEDNEEDQAVLLKLLELGRISQEDYDILLDKTSNYKTNIVVKSIRTINSVRTSSVEIRDHIDDAMSEDAWFEVVETITNAVQSFAQAQTEKGKSKHSLIEQAN